MGHVPEWVGNDIYFEPSDDATTADLYNSVGCSSSSSGWYLIGQITTATGVLDAKTFYQLESIYELNLYNYFASNTQLYSDSYAGSTGNSYVMLDFINEKNGGDIILGFI
jgi:hypothetical protein